MTEQITGTSCTGDLKF